MASSELDSFVGKFKQLSLTGISATLNLETIGGKTTVCLKAEIGFLESTRGFGGNVRTPGYNRRRFYKQEVINHKESSLPTEAEQATDIEEKTIIKAMKPEENITKVNTESQDKEPRVQREAEQASSTNGEVVSKAVKPEHDMQIYLQQHGINVNDAAHELSLNRCNKEVTKVLAMKETDIDISTDNLTAEQADGSMPLEDDSGLKCKNNGNDNSVALVYATPALKDCPHSIVEDLTLDAISKILSSKEHLRDNLKSFEFGNIRNRPMFRGSSKYMHEVEISLKVMKNRLWKSARSYLWKNLGTASWSLHDGTQVTFIKIHQK